MLSRSVLTGVAFRLLQAGLVPVAVPGYVVFVVRLLRSSRRSDVSATVLASLYTRYMQHRLRTRDDEPAATLLQGIPAVCHPALALVTAPTLAAHRLTRHVPRIYRYPYEGTPPLSHQAAARTTFYDAALARHLRTVDQLVVLGAGLDTRSYTLPPGTPVQCFELDTATTQAFKRSLLAHTGLPTTGVSYVPVDFRTENWLEKAIEAGFDPTRPSFYLWEAVTMYLNLEAVQRTLSAVASTAEGSVVAFDYFATETLRSRSVFMRYARAATRFVGEPLTFGLDTTAPTRERITAFLAPWGLVPEEHRVFGRSTRRHPAPAGFITAVLRRSPEPVTGSADGMAASAPPTHHRR
jgi:methyltransferase (TIGR00027 family)